jgi:hypothetical protein
LFSICMTLSPTLNAEPNFSTLCSPGGFSAACNAWLMARAPVTLRFIGHSTWMSRNGSTPNFPGSRVFTRSTTVCAMASGSSTGSM